VLECPNIKKIKGGLDQYGPEHLYKQLLQMDCTQLQYIVVVHYSIVGFNVSLDTIYVISFGDDLLSQSLEW